MDIEDFSQQLLVPAMQAFANKVDALLLGLKAEVPATDTVQNDVIDARAYLTKNAAPLADRRFVYGSDTETKLPIASLPLAKAAVWSISIWYISRSCSKDKPVLAVTSSIIAPF